MFQTKNLGLSEKRDEEVFMNEVKKRFCLHTVGSYDLRGSRLRQTYGFRG